MSSGAIDPAILRLLVLENAAEIESDTHVKNPPINDEDLIVLAEAGDCNALTLLFDRYSSQIFNIGFRILKDRGEAEDLVQEVFLGLFDKVKGFDPERGCGRTWIMQIAYRDAFDRRAYLMRRSFYSGTDIERVANLLSSGLKLERQIADCLVTEQLRSSFSELNQKQRNTLQMFFLKASPSERSVKDWARASKMCGISIIEAWNDYGNALQRLTRTGSSTMSDDLKTNPCEDIAELCALATTESLTAEEWERLQFHVAQCGSCASLLQQYRSLVSNEMAALAAEHSTDEDSLAGTEWDHATAKQRFLIGVRERTAQLAIHSISKDARFSFLRFWSASAAKNLLRIAAILLVGATTAYWFGFNAGIRRVSADSSSMTKAADLHSRLSGLLSQKTALEARLANETETISRLQVQGGTKEKELSDLKTVKSALEGRLINLTSQNQQQSTSLAQVSGERTVLEQKMHVAENLIRSIRQQLQSSEDDRHQLLLRTASLESQIEHISAQLRDQQDNSNRQQQFLAEDRDIRELMGARQLYIADVFDVDPQGKNKKPYGRVFFTKGKSLIFYAFDLDQQPGYRNASAFQAWGSPGSQANPISLGIFYMDSQANRRWVLQATDPRVLDQISAVFVTVEPKGGSKEPTNKPFLLAYLHATLPNHP